MSRIADYGSIHARSRTEIIRKAIRDALLVMEREVVKGNGIYPHNKGNLSIAEVCRRAGVHKVTVQGSAHKLTTKPMIVLWIQRMRQLAFQGAKVVRSEVTRRADDWKEKYQQIASQYQAMYAIEVVQRDARIEEMTERIARLESEIARSHAEGSRGKIVPMKR